MKSDMVSDEHRRRTMAYDGIKLNITMKDILLDGARKTIKDAVKFRIAQLQSDEDMNGWSHLEVVMTPESEHPHASPYTSEKSNLYALDIRARRRKYGDVRGEVTVFGIDLRQGAILDHVKRIVDYTMTEFAEFASNPDGGKHYDGSDWKFGHTFYGNKTFEYMDEKTLKKAMKAKYPMTMDVLGGK